MPAIPTVESRPVPVGDTARLLSLGALVALLALIGEVTAAAAQPAPILVTYVSETAVYLDAGRAAGLAVGTRLRLTRDGAEVAELEVDFVAEHSASCRIVRALAAVRAGDRAIPVEALAPPPAAPPESAATPPPPGPELPTRYTEPPATAPPAPTMRTAGTVAVGWRQLGFDAGPTSTETGGRLSLRVDEIAGRPLALRVRLRARRTERDGYRSTLPRSSNSDRLHELALSWAPPEGRLTVQLGRLAASRFATLGYLDGALAEVRLAGGFAVGAFAGRRPDLTELGLDSSGRRWGAWGRWESAPDRPGERWSELLIGAVSESADSGETSRDFLAIESRFGSGTRWWLSQRAEIDVHRDWREEVTGESSQLSNAALAASVRLSPQWRASLSYDQRRNFPTWEDRPRPEEVFVRHFREGARLGADWTGGSGWHAGFGVGLERAREIDDPTTSGWLSVLHSGSGGLPLSVGGDATLYSGGTAEGWVASLRGSWLTARGHDLGLTVGAAEAQLTEFADIDPQRDAWARLSGTARLPAGLWLYGEYERGLGDETEGHRAALEFGYRF